MSNPVIADNKPRKVTLKKGEEYLFCTCGRSDDQPFCDGSHADTDFTPKSFVAEKDEQAVLCQCKYTGDAPFCDGTHARFDKEQVGKEGPEDDDGGDESDKDDGDSAKAPEAKATQEEPTVAFIHQLSREGLDDMGPMARQQQWGFPVIPCPTGTTCS